MEELCIEKERADPREAEGSGGEQCCQLYRACICCVGNNLYLWDLVKCQENPEGEATLLFMRCYQTPGVLVDRQC